MDQGISCGHMALDSRDVQKSTEQRCISFVEIGGLRSKRSWLDKSEALSVDLMDEEVAKGNRPTTTFTKTSWNNMKSQLNAST
uniref:Myb/SANT-like domain-containing protein n=1 Tax=Cucumis melo TaxID=3656 RepID=A0A9I9EB72_CUCME